MARNKDSPKVQNGRTKNRAEGWDLGTNYCFARKHFFVWNLFYLGFGVTPPACSINSRYCTPEIRTNQQQTTGINRRGWDLCTC